MTIDPVVALESLGYTEREASFLYLVAIYSGYFLRRQFNYFIDRQKGYLSHRFVEKARVAGHIEIIDYGQKRFVYHLFAKPLYRLLGNSESQNRRRKGDSQVRARLMALDYVLENSDEHYLETEKAKLDFFTKTRGVNPDFLSDGYGRMHPFVSGFPVSVVDQSRPATSVVRFPFMDEGLLSTKKFSRFLSEMLPLLFAIGNFEVIYAATSATNFVAAEEVFWRTFARPVAEPQQVFADFRPTSAQPRVENRSSLRSTFTTLLFQYSYPSLLRNEPRGSVQGSEDGSEKQEEIA
jgi:hypothetical protein